MGEPKISIRVATKSDLRAIFEVEHAVFEPGYSLGQLRQLYELFRELVFLAEDEKGRVSGYLICGVCSGDPAIGLIRSMGVHLDCQGRGIGSQLLSTGVQQLIAAGCQQLDLTFDPKNRAAVGLYSRFGFAVYELVDDYFGDDEDRVLMR